MPVFTGTMLFYPVTYVVKVKDKKSGNFALVFRGDVNFIRHASLARLAT